MTRPTRSQLVLAYLGDRMGTWVYGPELANASVGGSEGLRRVRELTDAGWPIERRKRAGRQGWEYRLLGPPGAVAATVAATVRQASVPIPVDRPTIEAHRGHRRGLGGWCLDCGAPW
jgi:hypothetical protein